MNVKPKRNLSFAIKEWVVVDIFLLVLGRGGGYISAGGGWWWMVLARGGSWWLVAARGGWVVA